MVRIQRSLRQTLPLVLILCAAATGEGFGQKFLSDDPLMTVPEVAPVGKTAVQSINDLYDFAVHSAHYKTPPPTESLGVNSLGEVPNSSWFTNRDLTKMSIAELKSGPRTHGGPQPPFTVTAAKTEGVTPGFRLTDAKGNLYFVKVDPSSNPEMASAADVMGSVFLYAAGYNVPENYILVARKEEFHLSQKATITALSGKKHAMTQDQLKQILEQVPVEKDGRIRVMASLALSGKIVGPFRYDSVRSDDPNDLIPHQRRRDLRGLAVLFAFINHTDAKGGNSLDTVVGKGDSARFRHHLLDFGDSFGSDSDIAKDPRHGQEFFLPTSGSQWRRAYTFGLMPASWETVRYPGNLKEVGNFTAAAFEPDTWKPNYPNPAFLAMTSLDAYWGAKHVMSFRDEIIRALVEEAQYSDPQAVDYTVRTLAARRDAIGKLWFSRVLPLEEFGIDGDTIRYKDLNVVYGFTQATNYRHEWFQWDNTAQKETSIAAIEDDHTPSVLAATKEGDYIGCRFLLPKRDGRSATVYFKRESGSWKVVGITRTAL